MSQFTESVVEEAARMAGKPRRRGQAWTGDIASPRYPHPRPYIERGEPISAAWRQRLQKMQQFDWATESVELFPERK